MEQMGALRAILREQRQEVTHKIGLEFNMTTMAIDWPLPRAIGNERANSARSAPPELRASGTRPKGKVHVDSPLSLSPVGKAEVRTTWVMRRRQVTVYKYS